MVFGKGLLSTLGLYIYITYTTAADVQRGQAPGIGSSAR